MFPTSYGKTEPTSDRPKWTQNELTLKRKGRWKEATFTFASYETETTGGHFTKIFFDDLVCEGNVRTIESMDSVHEHWNKSFFKWDRRDKGNDAALRVSVAET